MVEPLDPYIEQYMAPADLDDYHPLYKELMNYGGQRYGLFDDGDTIILYYRTDLFEDPANKDAFKAQYGHELAAPKDWTEYDEIQAFFTEQGGGNTGAAPASARPARSTAGSRRSSATGAGASSTTRRWTPRSTARRASTP